MVNKEHPRDTASSPDESPISRRKIIPASEVGVSLTVSKKALDAIDQIEVEAIKADQEARNFLWR